MHRLARHGTAQRFRDASEIGAISGHATFNNFAWSEEMPHGHAPGHIRTPFLEAIEAYVGWSSGEPPPTVTREIKYKPFEISLADACRLVWNCTDILPSWAFGILTQDCDLPIRRHTYAAAARAILAALKAEGHDD